jgi:putative FmdB family regulatory protein
MPIYEYECQKCGHYLEALQKIADKPLRECPECGKHSLRRLVSAPMFRLSGSGWYETDFKSDSETKRNLVDKGEKDAPAAETKSDSSTATKTEGKAADSKPETKPEAKPAASADDPKSGAKRTMITGPAITKPAAKSTPARGRKAPARKSAASRRRR